MTIRKGLRVYVSDCTTLEVVKYSSARGEVTLDVLDACGRAVDTQRISAVEFRALAENKIINN